MKYLCFFVVLISTIAVMDRALAETPADEQAVRARIDSYVKAFNRGDSKALAGHWADGAEYVSRDTGGKVKGREAIEKMFAQQFAQGGPRALTVDYSLRFITPQVAIEDGVAQVDNSSGSRATSNYNAVHVKQGGAWFLDSVRETTGPQQRQSHRELAKLDWLIGNWVESDQGVYVRIRSDWTMNKNFIVRSYTVRIDGQLDIQGSEIIGWDPAEKQIRSWVFDNKGAFGEGTWKQEGNRWVVKASSMLPDGRLAAHVRVLTRYSNDTYTIQSVTRELDGNLLPNIEEFTVRRISSAGPSQ